MQVDLSGQNGQDRDTTEFTYYESKALHGGSNFTLQHSVSYPSRNSVAKGSKIVYRADLHQKFIRRCHHGRIPQNFYG